MHPAPCSWPISTRMGWQWKRWWVRTMVNWPHSQAIAASSAGARTLKNSGWGAKVSGLAVADLGGPVVARVFWRQPWVLVHKRLCCGWHARSGRSGCAIHAITALAAADVDGDGQAEVIAGTEYSTPLNVHNSDGSFRWTTFEEVGSRGQCHHVAPRHRPHPSAIGRCRWRRRVREIRLWHAGRLDLRGQTAGWGRGLARQYRRRSL